MRRCWRIIDWLFVWLCNESYDIFLWDFIFNFMIFVYLLIKDIDILRVYTEIANINKFIIKLAYKFC